MSRLTTFKYQDEKDVLDRIIASAEEEIQNEFPHVRKGSFNEDEPTVISQDRPDSSQIWIRTRLTDKPRTWLFLLFLGLIFLIIGSWLANYIVWPKL